MWCEEGHFLTAFNCYLSLWISETTTQFFQNKNKFMAKIWWLDQHLWDSTTLISKATWEISKLLRKTTNTTWPEYRNWNILVEDSTLGKIISSSQRVQQPSLNAFNKQNKNLSWVNLKNISCCFIIPLRGKASENTHTNSITTARSHRTNACRNELRNFEMHRNNERDKQTTTRTRMACFVYCINTTHTGKYSWENNSNSSWQSFSTK